MAVAAAATMVAVLLVQSSGIADGWADGSLADVAFAILRELNTWIWVLALLGAASALLNVDNRATRYAGEASYPVYILHQTAIIAVAYVVVGWDFGVWPSFATVLVGSFGLTLALYEYTVRRTRVTRFLFGMKSHPRQRPVLHEPEPRREPVAAAR
jgi:peptidoglycan/LPS O-acetylase OafA/YrhL